MFALAADMLLEDAGAEAGRIFTVHAPFLPWLAPACILAGVGLQLGALALCRARGTGLRKGPAGLCAAGALFVFAGAVLDRDVSVAVGDALAFAGIWFGWGRS